MPIILSQRGEYASEIKRSKFLGFAAFAGTEDSARQFLAEIRKIHPVASHHVYAYNTGSVTRMSDDGEPHGTGGMPVLQVYTKSGAVDFVCVVVRYYGGTKLGAGGLVRAYTQAAKGAMECAVPMERVNFKNYLVKGAYGQVNRVKYIFKQCDAEVLEMSYTEHFEARVRLREDQEREFLQSLSLFSGEVFVVECA